MIIYLSFRPSPAKAGRVGESYIICREVVLIRSLGSVRQLAGSARNDNSKIVPELPEVETIKRQLDKSIIEKKIISVEIILPKMIKTPLKEFKRVVLGSALKGIKRRAKLLIIELSSGYSLLIHLKMTGQLIFRPATKLSSGVVPRSRSEERPRRNKHTHLIFHFSDKSKLLYNDLRQFGYIKLIKTIKIGEINKEYGPEPLNNNLTLSMLKGLLAKKPRAKIKQFLMDQKNIAGIGNLYADEILFYAGVRPTRIIKILKEKEIKKIFNGIKKILTEAIKYHGSSVENYVDARGRAGEYHLRLKVYGRANQPCKKCGAKIQKIKLSGRGTHFCAKCQK